MAYGLTTYADTARRQDLLDIINDITPDKTPLYKMFSGDTARGLSAMAKADRIKEEQKKKAKADKTAQLLKRWLTLMS